MSDDSEQKTLKDWRRARWLTQAELAGKVGVSHYAVSNWETGIKKPRMGHMRKLAEVLGISPDQIILPERGKERPAA